MDGVADSPPVTAGQLCTFIQFCSRGCGRQCEGNAEISIPVAWLNGQTSILSKGDFSRRSIQLLQLRELALANGLLQAKLSGVTSGSMQLKQLCLFRHSAPFLGHMFQMELA